MPAKSAKPVGPLPPGWKIEEVTLSVIDQRDGETFDFRLADEGAGRFAEIELSKGTAPKSILRLNPEELGLFEALWTVCQGLLGPEKNVPA